MSSGVRTAFLALVGAAVVVLVFLLMASSTKQPAASPAYADSVQVAVP